MGVAPTSGSMSISQGEISQWATNAVKFLAPLGIVYLMPVIGILSEQGHTFSLGDFVPTSYTIGAIALYIVNTCYDFLRKFIPVT